MTTYSIKRTNGNLEATVPPKTVNTNRSISLIGQDTVGIGTVQNENFLHLMEHFASDSEPANPIIGQLWFDTSTLKPKICITETGTDKFRTITFLYTTRPSPAHDTDLYFDTVSTTLYIYYNENWIAIGPSAGEGIISDTASTITGSTTVIKDLSSTLGCTHKFNTSIIAKDIVTLTDVAAWEISGLFINVAGVVSIIGNPTIQLLGRSSGNAENWSVTVTAYNNYLRFTLYGVSGTNQVNWKMMTKTLVL